jgi:IS6 family transposase
VQKFDPELPRRTAKNLTCTGLDWHVDESHIRVRGKWRYLWRAIYPNGQLVDFRLTARRDAKSAKTFLEKTIERARLHRPVSIGTDKAPTYRKVIREINHAYDPDFDPITHIDRKYLNNRVESDHAALKRLLGCQQSFRSCDPQKKLFEEWKPSGTDISIQSNRESGAKLPSSINCLD